MRRAKFLTPACSNEDFKTSNTLSLKILSGLFFSPYFLIRQSTNVLCSNYQQNIVLNFRDFQMNQQISAFKELKFQCDIATGICTGCMGQEESSPSSSPECQETQQDMGVEPSFQV